MPGLVSSALGAGYNAGDLWGGVISVVLGGVLVFVGLRWQRSGQRRATSPPTVVGYPVPVASAPPMSTAAPAPSTPWPSASAPEDFFGSSTTISSAAPSVMPVSRPGMYSTSSAALAATTSTTGRGDRSIGALIVTTLGVLFLLGGLVRGVPAGLDALTGHHVALPQAVGPLHLLPASGQVQKMLDDMQSSIPSDAGVSHVQAGYYALGDNPSPAVVAIVAEIDNRVDVAQTFAEFEQSGTAATAGFSLTQVSTSGLPGRMDCGTVRSRAATLGACIWVDDDTLGIVLTAPSVGTDAAPTATQLRMAAES
jgi:hypothetical protein